MEFNLKLDNVTASFDNTEYYSNYNIIVTFEGQHPNCGTPACCGTCDEEY